MREAGKNNNSPVGKILSQLAAEKKKAVMAMCLIGVMVFMWVRLLGKKTPQNAEAKIMPSQLSAGYSSDASNSEFKISFTELPSVKGRNDILIKDFFAAEGWYGFIADEEGQGLDAGEVGSNLEGLAKRIAERLKLEVIELGENPQAFINNKLLGIGDKITVRDGTEVYECEIFDIKRNMVFVRCGQTEIQLKLSSIMKAMEGQ